MQLWIISGIEVVCSHGLQLTLVSLYGSGSLYAPAVANDLVACCETLSCWQESRPVVTRSRDVFLRAMSLCLAVDSWFWKVLGERNSYVERRHLEYYLVPELSCRCPSFATATGMHTILKDGWKLESLSGRRTVAHELA